MDMWWPTMCGFAVNSMNHQAESVYHTWKYALSHHSFLFFRRTIAKIKKKTEIHMR